MIIGFPDICKHDLTALLRSHFIVPAKVVKDDTNFATSSEQVALLDTKVYREREIPISNSMDCHCRLEPPIVHINEAANKLLSYSSKQWINAIYDKHDLL
jgi:hypothetical protein